MDYVSVMCHRVSHSYTLIKDQILYSLEFIKEPFGYISGNLEFISGNFGDYITESFNFLPTVISFGLGFALLWFIYGLFESPKTIKKSRKGSDQIHQINQVKNRVLMNRSTVEGLTLLVGELSRKVEIYEELNRDIQDKLHDLESNCKILDKTTFDRFKNVAHNFQLLTDNFQLLTDNLGSFTDDEYRNFVQITRDDLKVLRDAIFVPIDSEEDSEYIY